MLILRPKLGLSPTQLVRGSLNCFFDPLNSFSRLAPGPSQLALRSSQLILRPKTRKMEKIPLCGGTIGHRPLRAAAPLLSNYLYNFKETNKGA